MAGVTIAAELFRYHAWANQRLIRFCAELPDGQLDAPGQHAYGTIRDTLTHVVNADGSFLQGIVGERPDPPPAATERPSLEALAEQAGRSGAALALAAERLSADERRRVRRPGGERELAVGALFAQALNHAAEHRTQVVAMLNALEVRPPDLSGWAYGGDASRDYTPGA